MMKKTDERGFSSFAMLLAMLLFPLCTGELFRQRPYLMTHDSGTGLIGRRSPLKFWAGTQRVDLVTQLACGARVLDLRLVRTASGVHLHHGSGALRFISRETLREELPLLKASAVQSEGLVTLVVSHCFRKGLRWHVSSCREFLEDFEALDIRIESNCTLLDSMETSEISENIWAIDGACVKENWDPTVTRAERLEAYIKKTLEESFSTPFQVQAFLQQGWSMRNPFDEIQGRELNQKIWSWLNSTELFKGVNFLEINFICHQGPLMAKLLGTRIREEDLEQCLRRCEAASGVPLQWPSDMLKASSEKGSSGSQELVRESEGESPLDLFVAKAGMT